MSGVPRNYDMPLAEPMSSVPPMRRLIPVLLAWTLLLSACAGVPGLSLPRFGSQHGTADEDGRSDVPGGPAGDATTGT